MIIDAHVHITENGKWFNTNHNASVRRLIKSLEESKIDKAVVLPIAPFISNEFVAKVCSEYPKKLIGFASVNPLDSDAVKKLEEDVIKYDLKGLKLHPRLQEFQLADKNAQLVIKKAAELNIPVLIDAWIGSNDVEHQDLISSISHIAKKIPSAKLILAHLGGFNYDEIPQIARDNGNIYFDLSFVLTYLDQKTIHNYIVPIIKNIGANRLIYGSDYPEINLKNYYIYMLKIIEKIFNQEEKKLVFGGTIDNLINMRQEV